MDGEYRVLPHTADTGIEATAESFEAVVATAAVGMFDLNPISLFLKDFKGDSFFDGQKNVVVGTRT